MPDQDQIAIALQLVPGIGDDAAFGRFHGGSFRNGNIYPVVAARFKCLDDAPARGPAKFRIGSFGGRSARFCLLGRRRRCRIVRPFRVACWLKFRGPHRFWFCGYGS